MTPAFAKTRSMWPASLKTVEKNDAREVKSETLALMKCTPDEKEEVTSFAALSLTSQKYVVALRAFSRKTSAFPIPLAPPGQETSVYRSRSDARETAPVTMATLSVTSPSRDSSMETSVIVIRLRIPAQSEYVKDLRLRERQISVPQNTQQVQEDASNFCLTAGAVFMVPANVFVKLFCISAWSSKRRRGNHLGVISHKRTTGITLNFSTASRLTITLMTMKLE